MFCGLVSNVFDVFLGFVFLLRALGFLVYSFKGGDPWVSEALKG